MDSRYIYTAEDHVQPVYCSDCRTRIPRAVLARFGNVCPECESYTRSAPIEPNRLALEVIREDGEYDGRIVYGRINKGG